MDSAVLASALELAPGVATLAELGRKVNVALDLDWSEAKWRGEWKKSLATQVSVQKVLGTAIEQSVDTISIDRDVNAVQWTDAHAPEHDPWAIELAAKVTRWWEPDLLIVSGDGVNWPQLGSYPHSPAKGTGIQPDVDSFQTDVLGPAVDAVERDCEKIYVDGNHDERYYKAILKSPTLYNVRSLAYPEHLGLNAYGFKHAHRSIKIQRSAEVSHGEMVGAWGGGSAQKELHRRRYSISSSTGHTHRSALMLTRTEFGLVWAMEAGCLCKKTTDWGTWFDWQQGLGLLRVQQGEVWMLPVVFSDDYSCSIGKDKFSIRRVF